MESIKRSDVNEQEAYSSIVEAGDFIFISQCDGNQSHGLEGQIYDAIDHLKKKLETIGLTLDSVVKMDCQFIVGVISHDDERSRISNNMLKEEDSVSVIEKVFKERFNGKYPARRIQVIESFVLERGEFFFQLDAIAYNKK